VKRVRQIRIRQVIVALVGLFYLGLLYPLFTDLWRSKWLIEMHDNECGPMFLSFFVALGVFLLLAARKPIQYRLVIAFAAWQALTHSATMLIQSVETSIHGVPRGYLDVILFGVIGIGLLFLVPPKEEASASL
jgi:4-amino-4-deoxy-L-arabinose transferase-like glycosyltransferase